jgi:hypothetical protein
MGWKLSLEVDSSQLKIAWRYSETVCIQCVGGGEKVEVKPGAIRCRQIKYTESKLGTYVREAIVAKPQLKLNLTQQSRYYANTNREIYVAPLSAEGGCHSPIPSIARDARDSGPTHCIGGM